MNTRLSLATVTAALRYVLADAFDEVSAVPKVTSLGPAKLDPDSAARINVFLYQVSPNAHFRDATLPTRRADGSVVQVPAEPLELQYLITVFGDADKLEPERLLGGAMGALIAHRTLSPGLLRQVIDQMPALDLGASALPDQRPVVSLSLFPLAPDAMRQLWSGLFAQQPYRLSIAITASVVFVSAEEHPKPRPPVRPGGVAVRPAPVRITGMTPGVRVGKPVAIYGTGLDRKGLAVHVGAKRIASPTRVQDHLVVDLTSALLAEGQLVCGVNPVRLEAPDESGEFLSDIAWLVIKPRFDPAKPPVLRGRQLEVTLQPAPADGARVVAELFSKSGDGQSHRLETIMSVADSPPLRFSVPTAVSGRHWLRVTVGGLSTPITEREPAGSDEAPTFLVPELDFGARS